MTKIQGGSTPTPFKPTAEMKAYEKQADTMITTQLQSLGFAPDYINAVMGQVQRARQQYYDMLGAYAGPPSKDAPKATAEEKYMAQLWGAKLQSVSQQSLVMQQVALAQLGFGGGGGFSSWGAAAGATGAPAPTGSKPA